MLINIQAFTSEDEDLLNKAYQIREVVFVIEQNVDKFLEYDGLDDSSTHFLIELDGTPVGTARYRETEEGIKLERFAVIKEYRGKSLASLLVRMILDEVKPSKKQIYLYSQDTAVSFYEIHGFKKEGEAFEEANIQHFKMVYKR